MEYLGLKTYEGIPEELGNGVTVKVENVEGSEADNPRYIHIMLEDCHKPAYFESHNNDQVAEIYALRFFGDSVQMTKILDLTGQMRDPHIAVAPNRRQLYVVDSDASDKILVYDLYSMSSEFFLADPGGTLPSKITQLVYANNTLYAADMGIDSLTFYVLNPDGFTYSLYSTIVLNPGVDFSGGDLIATDAGTLWSFSKNGATAYVHEINLSTGDAVLQMANEAGMTQVFGAMVYEDLSSVITGDRNATGLENWIWTTTGGTPPVDFSAGTPAIYYPTMTNFDYTYGDLASPFLLHIPD
jgi:hypothetical protein